MSKSQRRAVPGSFQRHKDVRAVHWHLCDSPGLSLMVAKWLPHPSALKRLSLHTCILKGSFKLVYMWAEIAVLILPLFF